MLKLSINFEEILSGTNVNSEEQNKALESSTIISNHNIIIIINIIHTYLLYGAESFLRS
jgi:hypothetical protein